MRSPLPPRLFVTGTDTGVGKTLVSAVLVAGLSGIYWKPIQAGTGNMTDTDWVRQMTGLSQEHFLPEAYRLSQPLSPHAAAAIDNVRIELNTLNIPEASPSRHLVIEGAGGVMVPINEEALMLDLMRKWNLPVLLVARSTLGTINHTLLSLEQLRRAGVDVLGVVMNGPKNPSNREAIERFGRTRVLAEIGLLPNVNVRTLKQTFETLCR